MDIDPDIKKLLENSFSTSSIIQMIFSSIGLIFYLIISLLFKFYYKCPSLIKKEIFSFIFLCSLKSLLELILISSTTNYMTSYFIEIFSFYLIIIYINKCLTSEQLFNNSNYFGLTYKSYICIVYLLISFPFAKIYNLSEKYIFSIYLAKMIIIIITYKYIKGKIELLLDYLKEKNEAMTIINENNLSYIDLNFYYTSFKSVNYLFFNSFIFIICYFLINLVHILIKWEFLTSMAIACQNFGIFCLIIGCLLLCYCFNKTLLDNGKKLEEENGQKLNEINVKIQHNENEEKITLSPKKKEDNANEIKLDKNEDTYVEIDEEEIKDKFKENNIKGMEEAESLNK